MNYVMIQYSDDGGETWSHEMWKPLLGPDKNYRYRVVLGPTGSAYDRIWKLKCSDNISFTLVAAHATISVGT